MAVGDCSATERRRWRPPYQTGKTVHVHAKHYKHNKDGRTAPGVCGNGSVPLSHSGNVITRIGIHTSRQVCKRLFNPKMVCTVCSLMYFLQNLDTNYSCLYLLSLIMCERFGKNNCQDAALLYVSKYLQTQLPFNTYAYFLDFCAENCPFGLFFLIWILFNINKPRILGF